MPDEALLRSVILDGTTLRFDDLPFPTFAMKKRLCLLGVISLVALVGCDSTPQKPAAQPAATPMATQPVAAPVSVPVAAHQQEATAAAKEAAQRLMDGMQPHEMLKTSAFVGYPQFTSANWSGLVLNSKVSTQSLAHTSNFRILRIEIHPLMDGRVRVWVEIANFSGNKVTPEVACQFTPEDDDKNAKFTSMPELGAGKRTVTYFESRQNAPNGYSLLARNKRQ